MTRYRTYVRAGTPCPRCLGSMFPERIDTETRERLRCLACGHLTPLPAIEYLERGGDARGFAARHRGKRL